MHFFRYKTFDHASHSKHSTPLIYILASFLFVVVIIGSVVSWLSLNAKTSPQITLKRMGRLRRVTRPQFQAARSVLDSGYDSIDEDPFKVSCRLFDDTDHGCGPGGECFYNRIDDFYTRACECKQVRRRE